MQNGASLTLKNPQMIVLVKWCTIKLAGIAPSISRDRKQNIMSSSNQSLIKYNLGANYTNDLCATIALSFFLPIKKMKHPAAIMFSIPNQFPVLL